MVAAALNRHPCDLSKQAGLAPPPISIWPIISAFYLPFYLPFFSTMLRTAQPAGMYYARLGAGPVTTCGPAHFASDD
jgi:hypothetical protein